MPRGNLEAGTGEQNPLESEEGQGVKPGSQKRWIEPLGNEDRQGETRKRESLNRTPPGKQKWSTGKGDRRNAVGERGNPRTGGKEPGARNRGLELKNGNTSEKRGRPRGNLEAQPKTGTLLGNEAGEPE
jgi:hypothetical protein